MTVVEPLPEKKSKYIESLEQDYSCVSHFDILYGNVFCLYVVQSMTMQAVQ